VTKGTALYGIKKDAELFVMVVTLLAFGCPVQVIVHAMGLDERTVRSWWINKAGEQSNQVHEVVIGSSQLDLQQVQADEIKVKTRAGSIWMALAMMVSTRLWLGGVLSPKRDKVLIEQLVAKIRQVALCRDLLLAVDGLASYVKAFQKAFRSPYRTGKQGRPRLIAWQGLSQTSHGSCSLVVCLGLATVAGGIAGGVAGLMIVAGPLGFTLGAKAGQTACILGVIFGGSVTIGVLASGVLAAGINTGQRILQERLLMTPPFL
jgi:hypothetical protein